MVVHELPTASLASAIGDPLETWLHSWLTGNALLLARCIT
jgi:hypothetical protein